jgi:chromosome segregation ATPase
MATNHEPNNAGEIMPSDLEKLRIALHATQADLERVAEQRDALRRALADQLNHGQRILRERNEAQLRCRELADVCLGQQSLIVRLFDQLGACIRSLRHAEHLAGIGLPGSAPRILRVPGITVRLVS